MRRGRARTFEERKARAVKAALDWIRIFDDRERKLAQEERLLKLTRNVADSAQTYADLMTPANSRGARWSATYHARRARENVEISEAVVVAIRADMVALGLTTDCPAG